MSQFIQHREATDLAKALLSLRRSLQSLGEIDPEELTHALARANDVSHLPNLAVPELGRVNDAVQSLSHYRHEYLASLKEVERRPTAQEPQRIIDSDILVVTKFSKVQWDLKERNVQLSTLLEQYEREGVEIDKVLASHEHQLKALETLHSSIPNARFVDRDAAAKDPDLVRTAALVIAFGGDDNLKFVSQMVESGFLIGINSDPANSEGALTFDTVASFPQTIERLKNGEFLLQEWPRLLVSVNGTTLPPACSEIYIGDERNRYTARGRATLGDTELQIKGSGMIIANGAGSTGWFRAASLFHLFGEHTWLRTAAHAEFINREPHGSADTLNGKIVHGVLKPGEELTITSSSNHNPEVSVDSVATVPFPRGMTARVRFSNTPLKMVVGSKD